jgi:hypothetical protein
MSPNPAVPERLPNARRLHGIRQLHPHQSVADAASVSIGEGDAAAAAQWRENTADAVYTQPDIPVANTAGRPGAYTGSYGQLPVDWTIDRAAAFAVEAVHFVAGDALHNAWAHDSNYIGIEIKRGW